MNVRRHLSIRGRVQGVGFRAALAAEALRLGLGGWVRNRQDGSVEALVVGPPAEVEALVRWAHRGPRAAVVAGVEVRVDEHVDDADPAGFEQRPTV